MNRTTARRGLADTLLRGSMDGGGVTAAVHRRPERRAVFPKPVPRGHTGCERDIVGIHDEIGIKCYLW